MSACPDLLPQSKIAARFPELDPAWLAIVSRPRLAGTCWSGTDSLDGADIWRFLPGGALNYTSPSGTFQNATWVQVGDGSHLELHHTPWWRHIYRDFRRYRVTVGDAADSARDASVETYEIAVDDDLLVLHV